MLFLVASTDKIKEDLMISVDVSEALGQFLL